MLSYLFELILVVTTSLDGWLGGWVGGWVALDEWKLRLTSAKVELKLRLTTSLDRWLGGWLGGFGEMETKTNLSQS